MTATDVMNAVAPLLNDTSLGNFDYSTQLPFLNMAMNELQEIFELNNVPVTNQTSAEIIVNTGTTVVSFTSVPALPSDLIEVQMLAERLEGTTDDFTPMIRREFLPQTEIIVPELIYWAWIDQSLKFIGATSDRDVKLNYVRSIFTEILDIDDEITVINCKSFLTYRTAALIAEFIGENESRANSLNGNAILALDRTLGINTKGRQAITTRRRPFRASAKTRGW